MPQQTNNLLACELDQPQWALVGSRDVYAIQLTYASCIKWREIYHKMNVRKGIDDKIFITTNEAALRFYESKEKAA